MKTEVFGATVNKDEVDWKEEGDIVEAVINGTPSVLSASGSPSAGSVVSEVRSHSLGVHCDRDSLDSEIGQSLETEEDGLYITVAESFHGISLSSLPKHVSLLERRKNEALEKSEARRCPSYKAKDVATIESLDSILKPHVSRLDREKAKYGQLKENKDIMDRYAYKKKENGKSEVQSLDAVLKKPVSKLEKYIQDFKERASVENPRTGNNTRKSKLQIEKEAAAAIFGSPHSGAKQERNVDNSPKDTESLITETEEP
eukprot:jgi/Picsp_1/6793/NSC_04132-R1_transport protein